MLEFFTIVEILKLFFSILELPEGVPLVRAQKSWYTVGDMLRVNCTSPAADPPANLTWLVNGYEVSGYVFSFGVIFYNCIE